MDNVSPIGTLSFPQLFKPRAPAPDAEPRYQATLLFSSDAQASAAYKEMKDKVLAIAKEKWGDKAVDLIKSGAVRLPFRDGSEKEYNGYGAGIKFVQFWSKEQPAVIDQRLNDAVESDVYPGCQARVNYNPFAYDVSGNKGISMGLNSIQITNTSTPRLDGRKAAKDVFDAIDEVDIEDNVTEDVF